MHVVRIGPAAPLAPSGGRTRLAASASSCSSSDATLWFKEPEGADRLAARKVKITILLLKTAYIVALQVHLSVPAPWLTADSQTPDARAGSPPLCCGAAEAACFEECRFIASQISCNGWLRRGGGGDYTDNYKTWECWKRFMPMATGDMPVVVGKNALPPLQQWCLVEPWLSMENL